MSTDKHLTEEKVALDEPSKLNQDALQLEQVGVAPSKLQRNFNVWSLAFMSFCSSVTWEAISSTMTQALLSGGSSSLVWGFLASSSGALLTVLCIAEYASMIPTAGGQYHYVAHLAPPKYRRVLSYFAGWITILGWLLSALAGIFSTAMQFQAWAILFSPDYVYERWHTSLIVVALTTCYTLVAMFDVKHIHHLLFLAMFCHVVGYLATVIYLLVHVPEKNTAQYVFTDATNLSGWENPGVGWLIGLLTSAIGFVNWDSPIHMAEESTNVSRDVPRSLLFNIVISALTTFPWVIAVAFCITDLPAVLSGPVGTISFMSQLFYNVSGGNQAATIGLTLYLPLMGFCGVGPSIITTTSRIVWAFARDGGLPRSFATVSERTKTPIAALLFTWAFICALGFIYVGNTTAYYGIISACTVALLMSYAFPLLMNVIWGFRYCHLPKGAFTLGRYHRYVAAVALAWCTCLTVMMCFPLYQPVTADNVNYASVVVCGGLLVAAVSWFTHGHTQYLGIAHTVEGETSHGST